MSKTIRYQVGVTFTIEEVYDIELPDYEASYENAKQRAVEMFKEDFSNMPLWAGDAPRAAVYDEEEIEDE